MAQIILDSTQTRIVLQAHDQVHVCDESGNLLGVSAPPNKSKSSEYVCTDEEIAAEKQALAAPGPRRTTQEVLEQPWCHAAGKLR